MTNENATMTLDEFLQSDAAGLSAFSAAENAELAGEMLGRVNWIENALAGAKPDERESRLFTEIEEAMLHLEGAVADLNDLTFQAHRALGHIDAAKAALDEFAANPTAENHAKLAAAAEPMMHSNIPMDASDKRKIRPFVRKREWRARISFGSLYWIVTTELNPTMITSSKEAA